MIPDAHLARVLKHVQVEASRACTHQGGGIYCDLAEYEDAAMEAIVHCLATYDASKGVGFPTFAEYRIHGAALDAKEGYVAWHEGTEASTRRRQAETIPGAGEPDELFVWLAPPTPLEDLAIRETFLRLAPRLPPKQRALLDTLLAGGTQRDHATKTGRSESNVSILYRHLRDNLRRWLTPLREDGSL